MEKRVREEGCFEVVKEGAERWCPGAGWNGFAVKEAAEIAKGADADFKVGDEFPIEVEKANEGVEGLAGSRKGPVFDHVELGGGRTIACRA